MVYQTQDIFFTMHMFHQRMHNNFLEFYFRTGAFGLFTHLVFVLMAFFKLFSPQRT